MKNHRYTLYLIAVLMVFLPACGPSTPASEAQGLTLEDCQLSAPGLSTRLSARCGALPVYEDRSAGSGRQIQLKVSVIPAVSRSPAPDPLFFLTGGPGQAATESYLQLSPAFERIHQQRDIVLVDQRGTGGSNPLDCPELEEEELEELPPDADLAPFIEGCLQALEGNPALYTTPIAMEDLDQVRAALGYETINLYGVSYGTRAALTYLQQYPGRVRTLILDGIVPQDEPLGLDVARDAQRALDLIFERCDADEACRQAFPDVKGEFQDLLEELRQGEVMTNLQHPVSGEATEVAFSADNLVSTVRLLSYAPETAALLPLLIHSARAEGDYAPLAAQYLIVSDQLTSSISEGMNYSVVCAEDVPFFSREQARQANSGTYLEAAMTEQLFSICETWPRGEVPAGFKEPVEADVPVLLLSGEADPVTPPENGEQVARGLPNSLHLVIPGQGHNVIYRGCLPRLAADFVESGSLEGLSGACAAEVLPMPFFVNRSGPNPGH
jgi:pimeloyl-ACP methyl ester carboxylesterase